MKKNTLEVKGLKTVFDSWQGTVRAVDDVSFNIEENTVFGLVGESGSGKTLTALSILRLIDPPGKITGGSVMFGGVDLLKENEVRLGAVRGNRISMVFQEPGSALDPVFTVGYQLREAIRCHRIVSRGCAEDLAIDSMRKVHIKDPGRVYRDYPHQISGGMKQRVMIAMALINSPELLILDEPTTALDVTIQAEILKLLEEIIAARKMSILFISHDIGLIARMCDNVGVMRKGKLIECQESKLILSDPENEYTSALLKSARALS